MADNTNNSVNEGTPTCDCFNNAQHCGCCHYLHCYTHYPNCGHLNGVDITIGTENSISMPSRYCNCPVCCKSFSSSDNTDEVLPPIQLEPNEDGINNYVTRTEINTILSNIATADIFTDESEDGTTVSVGGIKKGTKLVNMTFARLMKLMLYADPDSIMSMEYPDESENLNTTVKYELGGFKTGDSLKGMTIGKILETLLCGELEIHTGSLAPMPTPDINFELEDTTIVP